jgi:DNA-binding response OmpR family regulator
MMPRGEPGAIKIAILGGDQLVGHTLERLLQSVGYDARYLNGSLVGEPTRLPEGIGLVIFAPRIPSERRKAFLSRIRSSAATAGLPVLELTPFLDEVLPDAVRAEHEGVELVAWPCHIQELEREIEAALLNGTTLQG